MNKFGVRATRRRFPLHRLVDAFFLVCKRLKARDKSREVKAATSRSTPKKSLHRLILQGHEKGVMVSKEVNSTIAVHITSILLESSKKPFD